MDHSIQRAVIHAGSHKTGSTCLQHYFGVNRELLKSQGWLYPVAGCVVEKEAPGFGAHHRLVKQVYGSDEDRDGAFELLEKEIKESGTQNVLISSESFENYIGDESNPLARHLQKMGFHVEVVMYLRDHATYLEAIYNQRTKSLVNASTFSEFARQILDAPPFQFDYNLIQIRLVDTEGIDSIRFEKFGRRVKSRGLEKCFLSDVLRISSRGFRSVPRVNESVGPLTILAARMIRSGLEDRFGEELENFKVTLSYGVSPDFVERTSQLGWNKSRFRGLTQEIAHNADACSKELTQRFVKKEGPWKWAPFFGGFLRRIPKSNEIQSPGELDSETKQVFDEVVEETLRAAIKALDS